MPKYLQQRRSSVLDNLYCQQWQQQQPSENKQNKICSEVHTTLETFAGLTSLHGVPRIINAHSMAKRLLWTTVSVFAIVMFIYTGKNLLEQYFSYPKKVNVEIVQNPVPFPSVTVCNTNHLDFMVVQEMEKVFETEENNASHEGKKHDDDDETAERSKRQIKEKSARSNESNRDDEFRKSYLKFHSIFLTLMQYDSSRKGDLSSEMMKDSLELMSRLGLVANVGPQLASKASIRAEDFIVYCRFMEEECNVSKTFVKIFDPYFFNCYTFEPHRILHSKSTRLAGIEYGLTLLLFTGSAGQFGTGEMMIPGLIEADPALASNEGAKVVIHSQNSIPHFTTDGYDIPYGYSVNIGIKARQNVRVSLPHGNCTDEEEYKQTSGSRSHFKYTLISCQNECIQSRIAEACHCNDNRMPYREEDLINIENIEKQKKPRKLQPAGVTHTNTTTEARPYPFCLELPKISRRCRNPEANLSECKLEKMASQFNARTKCRKEIHDRMTIKQPESIETCKCFPPCKDVIYDAAYSISRLPEIREENTAFYSTVERFVDSMPTERRKALEQRYGENNTDNVKNKISRLNVYIADNNIIKTTESPDYDLVRLVSDIGGQMGLWIGISVITLVEVVQLVFDLCAIFLKAIKTLWDMHVLGPVKTSDGRNENGQSLSKSCPRNAMGNNKLHLENSQLDDKLLNKLSTV